MPKNIASDVRSYKLSNNSEEVYYLNQEKNLILVDLDSDEEDRVKEEISDNTTKWNLMSNHIIYLTEDKELYIKELGKEKEKIDIGVIEYSLSEFEETVSYYNEAFELYIKTFGKESEKVVDNINDYSNVYFSNQMLFKKMLRGEDVVGYWNYLDMDDMLVEITKDKIINFYSYGQLVNEIKIENVETHLTDFSFPIENDGWNYIMFYWDYLTISHINDKEITMNHKFVL